jgi:hypothetical protein
MDTGNYSVCLSFCFYDTEDTKYSLTKISNRTENGIKYKDIMIVCYSIKLNENITPKEYADIVYEMVGAFLIDKYKKITKEIIDKYKNEMDNNYIESFKFPAVFEDQKYLLDEEEGASYSNGETLVKINIKDYNQK